MVITKTFEGGYYAASSFRSRITLTATANHANQTYYVTGKVEIRDVSGVPEYYETLIAKAYAYEEFCIVDPQNNWETNAYDYYRGNKTFNNVQILPVWEELWSFSFTVPAGNKEVKLRPDGVIASTNTPYGPQTYTYYWVNSGEFMVLPRLYGAAYVTSAPNFTDKDTSVTIQYKNPAGSSDYVSKLLACINVVDDDDDIPYREIPRTGTSYTFNFTEAQMEDLRQKTQGSNSKLVSFYIRTIYSDGERGHHHVTRTFTVTDTAPGFSETEVYDQGSFSTTLTGDPNRIIQGYNNVKVKSGAYAVKGATIKKQTVTCGGTTYDLNTTTGEGLLPNVQGGTFVFTVEDSRGNKVSNTIERTLVPYVKPTITLEAKGSLDGATNTTMINYELKGAASTSNFGAVINEPYVEYNFRPENGTYQDWIGISTFTVNENNTYQVSAVKPGLDYQATYVVQARIRDNIYCNMDYAEDFIYSNEITIQIIPVFDWSKEDFNFNVPVSFQGKTIGEYVADSLADAVIETGTAAMGSNGTWTWAKWKSGKAECWGQRNYGNMAINTAWGNWYESESFVQTFPTGLFSEAPTHLDIEVIKSNGSAFLSRGYDNTISASDTGKFNLTRPTALTLSQVHLGFYAIGKWK